MKLSEKTGNIYLIIHNAYGFLLVFIILSHFKSKLNLCSYPFCFYIIISSINKPFNTFYFVEVDWMLHNVSR